MGIEGTSDSQKVHAQYNSIIVIPLSLASQCDVSATGCSVVIVYDDSRDNALADISAEISQALTAQAQRTGKWVPQDAV